MVSSMQTSNLMVLPLKTNRRLRGSHQPQRLNGVLSITHSSAAHRARVSNMLGRGPWCSTAGLGLYNDDCPCPRGCCEKAVYRFIDSWRRGPTSNDE